jgi:hypothetical protein
VSAIATPALPAHWNTETHFSVLPGIAFSLNLIETTEQYGVAEVLVSSFMAAFIFSVFGAQPLTIAGVTGMPFSPTQR